MTFRRAALRRPAAAFGRSASRSKIVRSWA